MHTVSGAPAAEFCQREGRAPASSIWPRLSSQFSIPGFLRPRLGSQPCTSEADLRPAQMSPCSLFFSAQTCAERPILQSGLSSSLRQDIVCFCAQTRGKRLRGRGCLVLLQPCLPEPRPARRPASAVRKQSRPGAAAERFSSREEEAARQYS